MTLETGKQLKKHTGKLMQSKAGSLKKSIKLINL